MKTTQPRLVKRLTRISSFPSHQYCSMSAKILACTMCMERGAADKLHVYMSKHSHMHYGQGGKQNMPVQKLICATTVCLTFTTLLVTQCVKKYFLHFSHFKMTLFPVCTVTATKRVDIYCIMEIRKVILFGVHLCVLAWCLYLTRSSLEPRSVLCQCLLELETKLRKDHKGLVRMDS